MDFDPDLFVYEKGGNDAIDSGKPIEESTKMSVDTFYETFRRSGGKCIKTPLELWPYPLLSEP